MWQYDVVYCTCLNVFCAFTTPELCCKTGLCEVAYLNCIKQEHTQVAVHRTVGDDETTRAILWDVQTVITLINKHFAWTATQFTSQPNSTLMLATPAKMTMIMTPVQMENWQYITRNERPKAVQWYTVKLIRSRMQFWQHRVLLHKTDCDSKKTLWIRFLSLLLLIIYYYIIIHYYYYFIIININNNVYYYYGGIKITCCRTTFTQSQISLQPYTTRQQVRWWGRACHLTGNEVRNSQSWVLGERQSVKQHSGLKVVQSSRLVLQPLRMRSCQEKYLTMKVLSI